MILGIKKVTGEFSVSSIYESLSIQMNSPVTKDKVTKCICYSFLRFSKPPVHKFWQRSVRYLV